MKRTELSVEEVQHELTNALRGGWLDHAVVHSIQVRLVYYFDASDTVIEIDALCNADIVKSGFDPGDRHPDFRAGRAHFLARLPEIMGLDVDAVSFNSQGDLELVCNGARAVFWVSEDDANNDEWAWRISVRESERVLREIVYSLDERRCVLLIE